MKSARLFSLFIELTKIPSRDWWIASTAIPLVAATTAPMANLMSVVALVTSWRNRVYPDQLDNQGSVLQVGIPDPHWYVLSTIIMMDVRASLTYGAGVLASMLRLWSLAC